MCGAPDAMGRTGGGFGRMTETCKWGIAIDILLWEELFPQWSNRSADDFPVAMACVALRIDPKTGEAA